MTESKLFVSSCSRREMVLRRRGHSWLASATLRIDHPVLTALAFVVVCGGAFLAGRVGI